MGKYAARDAHRVPAQVASVLSSGTGEFDEERILKELPKQLSLPERRVKSVINGQASDRKRDVLVQAVSMLRQRKLNEVVKCLNNLLACNKVRCSLMIAAQLMAWDLIRQMCFQLLARHDAPPA